MVKRCRLAWLIGLVAAIMVLIPTVAFAAGTNGDTGTTENAETIDTSLNGLSKASDGNWYYYQDGVVQKVTTVARNKYGWWYVKNGKVDFTANTIAKNENGWWYIKDGKVDFSYTGFAQNKNGWFYVEKGKVTLNKNGVIHGKVDGTTGWWYVVSSKVRTSFTGLGNYGNKNGWWYIKNGKVDFTHNGVEKNKNGWWYVVGGKVQFDYTGVTLYKNENGYWYVKGGKVDFSYNGTVKNSKATYKVVAGKATVNNPVTVICGDSIMSGMYASSYNGISKINVTGSKYVVAKGSLNCKTFRTSSEFNKGTGVQQVASYDPTRVYIMLGMNEVSWKSTSDIKKDYADLVNAIKKSCPRAQVVVLALSPVCKSTAAKRTGFKKSKVDAYNNAIKSMAEANGCLYYDYTSTFKDSDGYLREDFSGGDGIHWNSKAYAEFGRVISAYDATLN